MIQKQLLITIVLLTLVFHATTQVTNAALDRNFRRRFNREIRGLRNIDIPIDGRGNNPLRPFINAAVTPHVRIARRTSYLDGLDIPRDVPQLPEPR